MKIFLTILELVQRQTHWKKAQKQPNSTEVVRRRLLRDNSTKEQQPSLHPYTYMQIARWAQCILHAANALSPASVLTTICTPLLCLNTNVPPEDQTSGNKKTTQTSAEHSTTHMAKPPPASTLIKHANRGKISHILKHGSPMDYSTMV